MKNKPRFIRRPKALERLRTAVHAAGGQSLFAALHDISPQYLSSVLRGHADPGPKILTALNLRREEIYVQMAGDQS